MINLLLPIILSRVVLKANFELSNLITSNLRMKSERLVCATFRSTSSTAEPYFSKNLSRSIMYVAGLYLAPIKPSVDSESPI